MGQKIRIKLLLEAPPRSYSLKHLLEQILSFSRIWGAVNIFVKKFWERRKAEKICPWGRVSC